MCVTFDGMEVIDLICDLISLHSDTSTGCVFKLKGNCGEMRTHILEASAEHSLD